jgi:hypothetical protein
MSKLTTETIQAVATKYSKYLASGISYGDAMRETAKALGGTPCPTLLEALAKVHAAKYECNYTWNAAGSAVFHTGADSTRETRHDAAHKSWQRNVMVWFKSESAAKPVSHARISREAREAAKAYLAMFDNMGDAIKALKAVAK